jgi:hypothetical protein
MGARKERPITRPRIRCDHSQKKMVLNSDRLMCWFWLRTRGGGQYGIEGGTTGSDLHPPLWGVTVLGKLPLPVLGAERWQDTAHDVPLGNGESRLREPGEASDDDDREDHSRDHEEVLGDIGRREGNLWRIGVYECSGREGLLA